MNIVLGVEKLKDHAVIVGLTATATQDIGVTPLSSEFMMVGSYHNIVNTILQRNFITKASPLISYGAMLILALIIGFIIQQLSATRSLIMLFSSLAAINIVIILLFGFGNLWVDQLGINLAVHASLFSHNRRQVCKRGKPEALHQVGILSLPFADGYRPDREKSGFPPARGRAP